MATGEDSFEINIYGEGEGAGAYDEADFYEDDEHTFTIEEPQPDHPPIARTDSERTVSDSDANKESTPTAPRNMDRSKHTLSVPSQSAKRKESPNERTVDSEATTALMLSDLHWWITEDDIRGWVNQAGAEDDLKEITFSEHKVNGKSKGQAYLDFASTQASTAAKHKIEALGNGTNNTRKFAVIYSSASQNPFKTLPKDAPARVKEDRSSRGGSFAYNIGRGDFGDRGGYRGRGRGYGRGDYNNQGYTRNFPGPAGGYNSGGGFQGNMGMANNFNFNRGGMMGNIRGNMGGMRGGRGGMNSMMPMGGMGLGMGMNPMMAGMGMQGFNPGMFSQGPSFGCDWGQPGAKRQRQD